MSFHTMIANSVSSGNIVSIASPRVASLLLTMQVGLGLLICMANFIVTALRVYTLPIDHQGEGNRERSQFHCFAPRYASLARLLCHPTDAPHLYFLEEEGTIAPDPVGE